MSIRKCRRRKNRARKFVRPRILNFETLSRRELLAADFQNPLVNVNGDDHITPLDAIHVIRFLNTDGPGPVIGSHTAGDPCVDVTGDGHVTPLDAPSPQSIPCSQLP